MRSASIVVIVFACAASSVAVAQQREPAVDMASSVAATTSVGSDSDGTKRGKSGFGQVMSVLTGLLQEAATKQSAGAPSAASGLLSSDESAVKITVTPVAGRNTYFVDKRTGDRKRSRSATTLAAGAATRDAMAMQAEGEAPD